MKIPLGKFVCITGVSGAGKSTLIVDILYNALAKELFKSKITPGKHERIEGIENIDKVVAFVSQKDKTKQKAEEIITKIQAYSPEIFIISSIGVAKSNCEKVKKLVMQKISSIYTCEFYESKGKKIFFLNRTDRDVL